MQNIDSEDSHVDKEMVTIVAVILKTLSNRSTREQTQQINLHIGGQRPCSNNEVIDDALRNKADSAAGNVEYRKNGARVRRNE